MRYVILKRSNGRLELNAERDLRPDTSIHDTKVYAEFPRKPVRPAGEPSRKWPVDYGAKREFDETAGEDGQGAWVWKFPSQERLDEYRAAEAKYAEAMPIYQEKLRAWTERYRAWEDRRRKAALKALKAIDPADVRYSFAGGSSKGRRLAPRIRLLRAIDQRKFDELDAQIIRLQERRAALIEAAFGRGIKPTPEQLHKVALAAQKRVDKSEPRYGYGQPKRPLRRGEEPNMHSWKATLNARWEREPKPKAAPAAKEAA